MMGDDILEQVRRIELTSRRMMDSALAGAYHSRFKGKGMEFADVREYVPGDDIRSIDWNVTAKMGLPFVKQYREERELTILLAILLSYGVLHYQTRVSTGRRTTYSSSDSRSFSSVQLHASGRLPNRLGTAYGIRKFCTVR